MKKLFKALPTVRAQSGKIKNVYRTMRKTSFTTLPNELLQDKRLSLRARGLLAMMLSMPEDWETYGQWIEENCKEGKDALQTVYRELEETGYLQRERERDEKTRKITKLRWVWFDEPCQTFPSDAFPADGKAATTKDTRYKEPMNKEIKTKEAKETPPASHEGAFVSYDAQWKPTQFTKEQKLAMIPMPEQYPSSDEFDRFVDDAMLCGIPTYRPDLYQNLCMNKWHTWDKRLMKWKPIIHWTKFVTGLNGTILSAYAK
jgi:hypothetical protein